MARSQPAFKPLDIVIYAALTALVAGLFVGFATGRTAARLQRLEVYIGDRTGDSPPVFLYDYAGDRYQILDGYADRIRVDARPGGYDVLFLSGGEPARYNRLAIEKAGEAYMRDADCSRRKDCTHFPHIDAGGRMIVCAPHRLTVVGVGPKEPADDLVDAVIG
ncbi:MAG: NusG domain II-containing protein [Clostridia bacterium]|nr:NusG domain II-containing protein [Clostridia bacterium]